MQPYEITSLFGNLKATVEQTGLGPMTDQALAILTLACVVDDCLRNIEGSLDSQ